MIDYFQIKIFLKYKQQEETNKAILYPPQ